MTTEAPFEALVLAAGAAVRFGGGKLLAPWRGGVLLDGALAAAFAAPVRTVTLVTGAQADQVAAAGRAFAEAAGLAERLHVVHASDHAEGMGASLRRGAATLSKDAAGVFVFLGDMPRVPHAVLANLADAVSRGAPAAAPAFAGQLGHPALFGPAMTPQLLELAGDRGARRLLEGLGARLAIVEAPDDGVLFDVDAPGDLA